ncbi:MAG: HPr family phosphocarrier protein [Candidatus Omnitrophica bacterium]|nr:HPr family phosphocarrier protein [Candidatus Omnitrophota bacterium]
MPARPKASPAQVKKRVHVRSRSGLHARPAALFVQVANRFKSTIRVRRGKNEADGKSIMGVLTLAAGRGAVITLAAEGPDAREAVQALEQVISHHDTPAVVHVVRHRSSHGSTAGR